MNSSDLIKALYLKYYPKLMVYGKTITVDESLIEDTIQGLFLTLWKKKEDLTIHSSLENYLFISFRNNLIRKIKNKSFEALPEELPEVLSEPIPIENEQQLKVWLEKLPPRQKEVLFLRYYQNKSYLEIAEMMGINYQVARNFSYRAIQFLKKNMKRMYGVLLTF